MSTTAANLKKKDYIRFRDEVYQVANTEFHHPGKGRTVMRVRLKNLKTGRTVDNTFTSSEQVEILDVATAPCQYLYKDNEMLYFMHEKTFEQHEVPVMLAEDIVPFLKEGQSMYVLFLDDKAIGVRPPKKVVLKVVEAEEAAKGDTATAPKKMVKLETGATVQVPLFIKKGEIIGVNPETGEYVGREN